MADELPSNTRLEAFSDGVFAIAITLLVLDLRVPELEVATPAALREALLRLWPNYAAFLVSFLTLLIGWVSHHKFFRLLRGHTSALHFANGLLLLIITAIPFPTALVARYAVTPAAGVAVFVYCGVMVLLSLAFHLIWEVARRGHAFRVDARPALGALRRNNVLGYVGYGMALLLALPLPSVALGLCALMAVFYAATGREER